MLTGKRFGTIKPRDITKEFQQKTIQFDGTFRGLKNTNWTYKRNKRGGNTDS